MDRIDRSVLNRTLMDKVGPKFTKLDWIGQNGPNYTEADQLDHINQSFFFFLRGAYQPKLIEIFRWYGSKMRIAIKNVTLQPLGII